MVKQTYTKEERKAQFLKTGLALAKKDGIAKVSAAAVAAKHNVTAPLVFHIFGSRSGLQAAIKREANKQNVTLAEPKKPAAPARKRSVAEVKAIKDKAAGKVAKKAAAKPKVKKVSRSAEDGKFVNKAAVAASPDTTVTQKVKVKKPAAKPKLAVGVRKDTKPNVAKVAAKPVVKYPTQPTPTVALPAEPKNSL